METLGLVVGSVLTLLIFSYLLSDNGLYRWALALVVGVAVGYAMAMSSRFVWLQIIGPVLTDQNEFPIEEAAAFLLLGVLLLPKAFSPSRFLGRISLVGNIPLGYLVGAGAAVSVAGALTGTLVPQVLATGGALQLSDGVVGLVQGAIVVVGTVVTLLYFSKEPGARVTDEETSSLLQQFIARFGRLFIVVALGAAFAGILTSALTALVMRIWQIVEVITSFVGG
ncbi:MAG: hypothetical protein ACP5JG_02805 [Anaerolineae bacterium]